MTELFDLNSLFNETDEKTNNKIKECFRIMIYAVEKKLPFDGLKEFFGFDANDNDTFIDKLVKNDLITVTEDNKFFYTQPEVVQALKENNVDETLAEERTKLFVFCQLGGVKTVLPDIGVADIPIGVKYLANSALEYCHTLLRVRIPGTVTSLGKFSFSDCTSLTSVVIGSGVTSIERFAFGFCFELYRVYYSGSSENWEKIKIEEGNECLLNAEIIFLDDEK